MILNNMPRRTGRQGSQAKGKTLAYHALVDDNELTSFRPPKKALGSVRLASKILTLSTPLSTTKRQLFGRIIHSAGGSTQTSVLETW